MHSRFGKSGSDVEQFFREVSNTRDPGRWTKVLSGYDSRSRIAAIDAIREVGLPASVSSAISKAKYSAVAPIGLADSDFPDVRRGVQRTLAMVGLAAVALALGAKLPSEHREALLAPFAEAGFTSALVGMPDEDGQDDE